MQVNNCCHFGARKNVKLVSLNWLHETRCLESVFHCARRISLCFNALTGITPAVLQLLLVYLAVFP